MFNAWRNFFVDPESGLPWATVMMFPWLKYGFLPPETPKVEVKIPETMKKSVSSSIKKSVKKEEKQEVKKEVKKQPATKKDVAPVKTKKSESKLPVKAAANSLIKVEKKLPAVKAESKVESKKTVAVKKVKSPLVINKKDDNTKTVEPQPTDSPTLTKKVESKKKKVEFAADEVAALVVEKKFTPINTDKLPVKEQNLITQTNPNSPKAQIREAIVLLCADWAEPAAIADVLKYKTTQLETLHLTPMVNSGQLLLRYPQDLTHPEQAYRAVLVKKSK